MTRSQRMDSVVRVAENDEQQAARVFADGRRHLEQQQTRLAELISYRDEYAGRFQSFSAQGMGAVKLNEYRMFLQRLNQAIEQQRAAVERAQRDCEDKRQSWLSVHSRKRALGKVAERFRYEEHCEAERREQKELDEFPTRPLGGMGSGDSFL